MDNTTVSSEQDNSGSAKFVLYRPSLTPTERASREHRKRLLANIEARAAAHKAEQPKPQPLIIPIQTEASPRDRAKAVLDAIAERIRALKQELRAVEDDFSIAQTDHDESLPIPPTVQKVQRAVAEYFQVSRLEMLSDRRDARVIKPRHVAMYLCREVTPISLSSLGKRFGKRDHTTILSACRKIAKQRQSDSKMDAELVELTALLQPV